METRLHSRFGGPSLPAVAAAAVLRARAVRAGVVLNGASEVDLAAACVTADAWMALVGADTLDRPHRYGRGSVEVVAAALARAAGGGTPSRDVPTLDCPSAAWLLALADEHVRWAGLLAGDLASDVLARSAWDLWAGGEGSVFASYGALLAVASANA